MGLRGSLLRIRRPPASGFAMAFQNLNQRCHQTFSASAFPEPTMPHVSKLGHLGGPLTQWEIQDPFQWMYISTIFLAIFCGDIP